MASQVSLHSPNALPKDVSPSTENISHHFVDENRASLFLKGFAALYQQKEFTDVALIVSGKEFRCHKNVLASSSPYFFGMFTSNLMENLHNKVRLKDMEPSIISQVLDYIYTGETFLTEDTVQNVLSAANLFQLIPLRNGCADFMMSLINTSNCIGIYFFAKAHQCDQLAAKAKEVINESFPHLCQENEFLDLPSDKLIEIIRDDELCVTNEVEVYEACLAWILHDLEMRKDEVFKVMQHVRFAIIDCFYFCDHIDSNQLLHNDINMIDMLDKCKYYRMLRNRVAEIDLNLIPRKSMNYIRGIVVMANPHGYNGVKKCNSMELLLVKKKEIKFLHKLPQGVYMPGACINGDNQIYVAGGIRRKPNSRGPLLPSDVLSGDLCVYDFTIGAWQVRASMRNPRAQFPLVLVDNYIYAVGGYTNTNNSMLDSVERYDPASNQWVDVCPMPKAVRFSSALGFRGRLYVCGGETDTEIISSVYRFSPVDNTWVELPSMSVPRALSACAVYRNQIYMIGGNSSVSPKWKKEFLPESTLSSTEIFDPQTNRWMAGPELPNPLCGAGAIRFGGTLMVVGGEDDKSWMAGTFTLQEDNPGNDLQDFRRRTSMHEEKSYVWKEAHELPTVMSTFGCVVANISKDFLRNRVDMASFF